MKMRKFSKRIVSAILAFSMIFSMASTLVGAYEFSDGTLVSGTNEANMPYFETVIVEEDTTNGGYKESTKTTFAKGDEVVIAVAAHNLNRFSNSSLGLKSLSLGLVYDTDYLEIDLGNDWFEDLLAQWYEELGQSSFYNRAVTGVKYSVQDNVSEELDLASGETSELTGANLKKATVVVDSTIKNTTQLGTINEGEYIALVKFNVKEVPADGTFTKAVSLSRSESVVLQLGDQGQTNLTYSAHGGLQDYLYLVDTANLWPASYSVKFYEDNTYAKEIDSKFGATNISEGTSYTDANVVEPVIGTDVSRLNGNNEYCIGFEYVDSDDNAHLLSNLSTINDSAVAKGTTAYVIKVYPKYETATQVTFKTNYPTGATSGGSALSDDSITKYVSPVAGDKMSAEEAPTVGKDATDEVKVPDGYSFDGWYYNDGQTDVKLNFDGNDIDAKDLTTVFAKWNQKLTIKFYPNDGTNGSGTSETFIGEPQTFEIDPNSTLSNDTSKSYAAPTRQNYKLKEWNTEPNGTGTSLALNDVATKTFAQNETYYAIWEVDETVVTNPDDRVTLTFNGAAADATLNNPTSITVKKGDSVYPQQLPADPTRTDYTFDGWFENATLSDKTVYISKKADQTAAVAVTENKTVYAHWTYSGSNPVTITFDDKSADKTQVDPKTVTIGKGDSIGDAMPTNPEMTTQAFGGWYTNLNSESTKIDKDTTFNADTTVYAKWIDEITVKYDVNGGVGTYQDVKGYPTASYSNPTTDPTRTNYTFVGWNTKPNGTGTFITSTHATFGDVSAAAENATTVTLYAYWTAEKDPTPETLPPSTGTPATGGVKVNFNSNSAGHKTGTVTPANPATVYIMLNDSIGTAMPNEPTSTNYKFVGWNTKADGSGDEVKGDTAITETLDGVTENNGTYELTVYAQWDIGDDVQASDQVTVKFNDNKDLNETEDSTDTVKTIVIFKGDSIGYDITAPDNGTFVFDGWKDSTSAKYDKDAAISADVTYYADWYKYLKAELVTNTAEYTGSEIVPKWNIYECDENGTKTSGVANLIDNDVLNADFTLTAEDPSNNSATIKDVNIYSLVVSTTKKGYKLLTNDNSFEVTAAKLDVIVDPDTQVQKIGSNKAYATITVNWGESKDIKTGFDIKYYKWTDNSNDGKIDSGELDGGTAAASMSTTGTFTDEEKYVIKVEPTSNFVINSVTSSNVQKDVLFYETGSAYGEYETSYAPTLKGQNIVFSVEPDDASINAISIYSDGNNTSKSAALDFYDDNTFANTIAFDNAQTPTVKEYWVRFTDTKADAGDFEIILANASASIKTFTVNDTAVTATQDANNKAKYTLDKTALANTGTTLNDVVIETSIGSKTIEYKFHIQRLVDAKITLNYGNSPVGEIMRDTNVTDKATAISNFKSTYQYTPSTPSGAKKVYYSPKAWGEPADEKDNLDFSETALFAFEYNGFVDPGFSATDSLGQPVSASDIRRSITVDVLPGQKLIGVQTTQNTFADTAANPVQNDTFTTADLTGKTSAAIKPDVYELTYSFEDSALGTITEKRKVVILPKMGDTNMDSKISTGDLTPIKNWTVNVFTTIDNTVDTSTYNLFLYRVIDTNYDTKVSTGDLTPIKNATVNIEMTTYYREFTK